MTCGQAGADITLQLEGQPGPEKRSAQIKRPKAFLPWAKSTAGGGGDKRKRKEALKQHVGIVRISSA